MKFKKNLKQTLSCETSKYLFMHQNS